MADGNPVDWAQAHAPATVTDHPVARLTPRRRRRFIYLPVPVKYAFALCLAIAWTGFSI